MYLYRRRLGMSAQQMAGLPWWERWALDEGLRWEFSDPDAPEVNMGASDDLTSMGFTVTAPGATDGV